MQTKIIQNRLIGSRLVAVALALITTHSYATLPPTNNLVLWLKPETLSYNNGDAVTIWTDSSGSGNDAIQWDSWDVRPAVYHTNAVNGRPAVGFGAPADGGFGTSNDDALFISNRVAGTLQAISLPSGYTVATAFKTFTAGDDSNFATSQNNYNNFFGDTANGIQVGLASGVSSVNTYDNQLTSSWVPVTGGGALNNTIVYQGHFVIATHSNNVGTANDTVNIYADNGPVATGTAPFNGAASVRRIGQGFGNGGDAFEGYIGEFLVYSAPLSGADEQQLSTYLTERWLDVPEPSAIGLAAMALIGLGAWRRRS
jgi:hypothetical protein